MAGWRDKHDKHVPDKESYDNHLVNLRNTFADPANKPQSYSVLLHEHLEAPDMPQFEGSAEDGTAVKSVVRASGQSAAYHLQGKCKVNKCTTSNS